MAADEFAGAACSFCTRPRREVAKLVAGPQVFICDGCIALCVNILDEEQPNGVYHAKLLLGYLVERPRRTPHSVVMPRLRAAIELAAGAPEVLREVAMVAARFDAPAVALGALNAIPAAERSIRDRLNVAALLSSSERHAEALAALDALEADELRGVDVILYRLHRAHVQLECGGLTHPQLAVHRRTALELAGAVAALPQGDFESEVRGERVGVLALALLGLGELEEAELAARERTVLQPDNAAAIELLARVLDARGEPMAAAKARADALDHAHPEGVLARKLRSSTGGPFR